MKSIKQQDNMKSEKPEKNEQIEAKKKALEVTFAQIDKQYGKGSVMLMGQSNIQNVEAISTGSILLDQAIGVGGFPRGRIVEIFGPEATGKTTLALHVIAQAQKKNGVCAFIDAEHALDATHASKACSASIKAHTPFFF